jgi:uncharacterized membrane protein HdeD (DUF308 family)
MRTVYSGNWWALALRGVAAIILGILAFMGPVSTLAAVVMIFGAYALVTGVLATIAAIRGMRRRDSWGGMLLEGIVGMGAGVIALMWPAIGALALVYLVAAWALFSGAFEIATAIKLRKLIKGEWLLILGGALSMALGLLFIARPAPGAVAIMWWLGAYALIHGCVLLALAFRVRRWMKSNPEEMEQPPMARAA